jgi:PleD family two-component response regulator
VGTAGTASYPVDADALLARADAACYRAKEGGRNRVEADAA